jgi:hypothetical protein
MNKTIQIILIFMSISLFISKFILGVLKEKKIHGSKSFYFKGNVISSEVDECVPFGWACNQFKNNSCCPGLYCVHVWQYCRNWF